MSEKNPENSGNTHKILIVEDNPDSASMLRILLESSGYDVSCAYDGSSALQMADTVRPDLALLDLSLPDMPGHDVGQVLIKKGIFVIALSGLGTRDDIRRSRQAGFVGHLVKPVAFEKLQRLVEELFVTKAAKATGFNTVN